MTDKNKSVDAAFSNRGDAMPQVAKLVDRASREFQLPEEVVTDLRIALDEVVTNIVKYAYTDDARHDITVRCEMRDGRLETTIEDDGREFDPLRVPPPDRSASLTTREVGGLGIYFVKKLMTAVSYDRVAGRNRLTLKQAVKSKAGA